METKDYNQKELKVLDALADGKPHTIAELKKLFSDQARRRSKERGKKAVSNDLQAQSFVRNSLRAPVRDGLVDSKLTNKKLGRGTYQLTDKGKRYLRQKRAEIKKAA